MVGYYWGMGFAWLGMVLSWVSAGAVAYLFRAFPKGQAPGHHEARTVEIPRQRYAKGEIGQEKLRARPRALGA